MLYLNLDGKIVGSVRPPSGGSGGFLGEWGENRFPFPSYKMITMQVRFKKTGTGVFLRIFQNF